MNGSFQPPPPPPPPHDGGNGEEFRFKYSFTIVASVSTASEKTDFVKSAFYKAQ
jgi:hypothetical protein